MTASGQLLSAGQFVVTNTNLAQQLASGKAQLATIGGQQVLIRTAPPGTATAVLQGGNAVMVTGGAVALTTTVGTTVPSLATTQTVNTLQVPVPAAGNLMVKTVGTPITTTQQVRQVRNFCLHYFSFQNTLTFGFVDL